MTRDEAKVGMIVYFGRSRGEQTKGEIVKVNRKNLKVKQLEERGTYRDYKVGTLWTVPPSLCTPAEGRTEAPKPRRRVFIETPPHWA